MNAAIDIGNTFTKIALFENGALIEKYEVLSDNDSEVLDLLKAMDFTHSIASGSGNISKKIRTYLAKRGYFSELTKETKLPFKVSYKTPETLGTDRIAAIAGAMNEQKGHDALVITAGTCITYNLLVDNSFLGGGISPGLIMRFAALNQFTDKLPLVENRSFDQLVGASTEESILSGVRNGILAETEGIIERYNKEYEALKVLITGGDSEFFESRLKNKIFADPNLILKGLNYIIDYNI